MSGGGGFCRPLLVRKCPRKVPYTNQKVNISSEANVLHRFWNSRVILQPRTPFYWWQTTQHMEIFIIKYQNDIGCILINFLTNLNMHIMHFITFSPTLFSPSYYCQPPLFSTSPSFMFTTFCLFLFLKSVYLLHSKILKFMVWNNN